MGIFSGSSSSKTTCPSITTGPQYGSEHILGSFTFHNLTTILCGAFTVATCLISAISLFLHATHFSKPAEQVKILRIIALVPVFAIVYLLAGAFLDAAVYLQPWADFYEAIALASYFVLLVQFLEPVAHRRELYFDRLELKEGGSSLAWYRRTWIFVFQYIVISLIVAVASDATQAAGVYCANGHGVHFAHIWLTVIRSISVAAAVVQLLKFYGRSKVELKPHGVVRKLIAIKGVVFLTFLQTIIFTILNSTGAVKPSTKLSYNDIYYGIPSILICGEMIFFALFQIYAYSARPYFLTSFVSTAESQSGLKPANLRYQGGFLGIRAFAAAFNPREILSGLGQMIRYIVSNPPVQRDYNNSVGMVPMHSGQAGPHQPPAYKPAGSTYQGFTAPQSSPQSAPQGPPQWASQRPSSPDPVKYGTVNQYTPLPRPQY